MDSLKFDPYKALQEIGQGGMGTVYLGKDTRLNRFVAIKTIRSDQYSNEFLKKFQQEAQLIAQLNHPAIVQIYDVITNDEGTIEALVMEYVEGTNLQKLLPSQNFSLQEKLTLMRDIAGGLGEAHRNGVIHRDLKCDNILITVQNQAKISDFGIASPLTLDVSDKETMGSLTAVSPEQAVGKQVDARSDLFSLGLVFYELLTGQHPFMEEGLSNEAYLQRLINKPHKLIEIEGPRISKILNEIIDKLLAKQVALRFQSVDELLAYIKQLQDLVNNTVAVDEGKKTDQETKYFDYSDTSASELLPRKEISWFSSTSYIRIISLLVIILLTLYVTKQISADDAVYMVVLKPEYAIADNILTNLDREGQQKTIQAFIRKPLNENLLRVSVYDGIVQALRQLNHIHIITEEELNIVSKQESPLSILKTLEADEIFTTKLLCSDYSCNIQLNISQLDENGVFRNKWKKMTRVNNDSYLEIADHIVDYLASSLGVAGEDVAKVYNGVGEAEYGSLISIKHRFLLNENRNSLLSELNRLIEEIQYFLPAQLLKSDILHALYNESRNEKWLKLSDSLLKSLYARVPKSKQLLMRLFKQERLINSFKGMKKWLDILEGEDRGNPLIKAKRAVFFYKQERYKKAINTIKEAIVERNSLYFQDMLAVFQLDSGQINDAVNTLNHLLNRYPDYERGKLNLADIMLFKLGKPQEALLYYQQSKNKSRDYMTLTNIGTCYLLLGNLPDAIHYYQQALDVSNREFEAVINLADAYRLLGNTQQSTLLYKEVISSLEKMEDKQWNHFTSLAQAYAYLGGKDQAVDNIEHVLSDKSNSSEMYFNIYLVYKEIEGADSSMAGIYKRKALKAGHSAIWFDFY